MSYFSNFQLFRLTKLLISLKYTHTHTHPFWPFVQVSQYQKGKTNLDFTKARDSEWQWHQPGHMQVYTSLQTDNHASNPPLSFLQVGCPSCRPTNSVKALKAIYLKYFVTSMCPISSCQLFTSVSDSSATETYFLKNQLHYNVHIEQVENFSS